MGRKPTKIVDPKLMYVAGMLASLCGMVPLDYVETEEGITFLVPAEDFRPVPMDVMLELQRLLKKSVHIAPWSEDMSLEEFVRLFFWPARVLGVEVRELADGRQRVFVKVEWTDRGKALGRRAWRLRHCAILLEKYFNVRGGVRIV